MSGGRADEIEHPRQPLPPTQCARSSCVHADAYFCPAAAALPENLCSDGALKLISYAPPHNHWPKARHLPACCRLSAAASSSSSVCPVPQTAGRRAAWPVVGFVVGVGREFGKR